MSPLDRLARANWWPGARATLTGLLAGFVAFALLVFAYGQSPMVVAGELLRGTAMGYGAGQVIYKATTLLFAGLAVSFALRAGLFNIGVDGQIAAASLAVALVGMVLPEGLGILQLPLLLLVGLLGGAAWAAIPALLKGYLGAHEVITTIMMNRIADAMVGAVLTGALAGGRMRTASLDGGARLPRLDNLGLTALHGSGASVAFVLALLATLAMVFLLGRTAFGRELKLVGQNPRACAAEKIAVKGRLAMTLLVSGAFAGLACSGTVLGAKGYYEAGLGADAGVGGIAVALLGRGHPVGLVLAALFFGVLQQGGLAINTRVPMEMMGILQGVVIGAIALADARMRGLLARAAWWGRA